MPAQTLPDNDTPERADVASLRAAVDDCRAGLLSDLRTAAAVVRARDRWGDSWPWHRPCLAARWYRTVNR